MPNDTLADDVLRGAEAIARFMGTKPRRVYYLAAIGQGPFFREGAILCARKSSILRHVEQQEQRTMATA